MLLDEAPTYSYNIFLAHKKVLLLFDKNVK